MGGHDGLDVELVVGGDPKMFEELHGAIDGIFIFKNLDANMSIIVIFQGWLF